MECLSLPFLGDFPVKRAGMNVLRQEPLGYALSHSQLRACVEAILKQQGDNKPLGKHWTTRFVKRHLQLSTKLGKRQEVTRFDGFTPKAVNWYFDIRENEYGWIKPENTVNVDEGGIMAGFGIKRTMPDGIPMKWISFVVSDSRIILAGGPK
ncbi:hypothetical protein FOTG_13874 [Fusarium oxysporum f. sp. vasinfectum 25433]|uniref:HTH CENPB-type domain-containing protein n=1 Tax=Fusarium oxysporum f. sp. vasinfectum 25433 TaxID=1089449 RepID=X0LAB0_FUSOX|nr:hypothetical protein FOTG_13874 [Fusarium oxysporum f. sp. vasinfectum 25433]